MSQRMSLKWCLAVLLVLLVVSTHYAHAEDTGLAVQIPAGKQVCVWEQVPGAGVKVFLHYMVTTGGTLDIIAIVRGPDSKIVWQSNKESENRVLFKTATAGSYSFCFSNSMSTLSEKVVSLSILVGDGGLGGTVSGVATDQKDSLQVSIERVEQGLQQITEIQSYLRVREHAHRGTTEVANTRVVVFSLFLAGALVCMGVVNVVYIRRIFTTKRMV